MILTTTFLQEKINKHQSFFFVDHTTATASTSISFYDSLQLLPFKFHS